MNVVYRPGSAQFVNASEEQLLADYNELRRIEKDNLFTLL